LKERIASGASGPPPPSPLRPALLHRTRSTRSARPDPCEPERAADSPQDSAGPGAADGGWPAPRHGWPPASAFCCSGGPPKPGAAGAGLLAPKPASRATVTESLRSTRPINATWPARRSGDSQARTGAELRDGDKGDAALRAATGTRKSSSTRPEFDIDRPGNQHLALRSNRAGNRWLSASTLPSPRCCSAGGCAWRPSRPPDRRARGHEPRSVGGAAATTLGPDRSR